jgi:hypothetical protein
MQILWFDGGGNGDDRKNDSLGGIFLRQFLCSLRVFCG